MVALRNLAVGLVAVQAVAAAVFVDRDVPVVVAVGVDVQQLGISVIPVFGRGPCVLLRGIVFPAGPVHPHFEIGGIPCARVGAELQPGFHGFQLLAGASEEAVDDRGAPLDPLFEPGAVRAFPAAGAVFLPCVDVLGKPFQLSADVPFEGFAREIREIGLDVVVTGAVEQDAVEVVLPGRLLEEGDLVFLHLRERRIDEEHLLAGNLQLRYESPARQVVHRLPFGMAVV